METDRAIELKQALKYLAEEFEDDELETLAQNQYHTAALLEAASSSELLGIGLSRSSAELLKKYFPAAPRRSPGVNMDCLMMHTASELAGLWSPFTTHHAPLVSAPSEFKAWFTEPRQERFKAWTTANRQVPSCRIEPDAACYASMGQLAKRLLVVAAVLDTTEGAVTPSQVEGHEYNQHVLVVTEGEIVCAAELWMGKRKSDYSLFCRVQGLELADWQYRHLLQVGELVQGADAEPPLPEQFTEQLGWCLDHVGRFANDGGRCLGFEVSDGVHTRCGVVTPCGGAWQLQLGSDWLPHPTLEEGSGMPALLDKLMLAYYAYQRLKTLLAVAAEPRADESSPAEPFKMAAGSLLEVLEGCGEDGGEDSGDGDSAGDGAGGSCHSAQRPHGQLGVRQRLAVRVSATLGQHELPAGGVALVLEGRLEGGPEFVRRDVIARVGSGPSLARTSIRYQKLAREHLALLALRGAGAPYLPRLVAVGVVARGSPAADVSGAPVLLTEPRGAPLHRHLPWHRGATMAPHHVLLAAACLAAAGCTLLAYGVRSNNIRPDNVTVTITITASAASLQGCIYHLVDLGAASCPALNSPAFRSAWGLTGPCDLPASAPVCDLLFGSLEALLGSHCCIDPPPLLPLSDLQSVLFTLVFLASGSLPWAQAARSQDLSAAIEGRQWALGAAAEWEGLEALPEPVAGFGAWVLGNAGRDTVTMHEVKLQVDKLCRAVQQDLGVSLPPLELPVVA